jgi:hypothetical protein
MAVIFMDGFDHYATADLTKRWTYATGCAVAAAYARLPSGQGVVMGSPNSSNYILKSFGANYTAGLVGFAFNSGSTSLVSRHIFTVLEGATEQCSIRTNASSVITVTQGGTVKATGSTVLSQATWYYVEFKFTIHQSTGIAQVKLNGAAEIASTSSLDLTGTANNYWNGIGTVGNSTFNQMFDDIYLLDTTTGDNTDFLGPVRCVALAPAAPGTTTAWTPNGGTNYGAVSEAYQDGDTSFNQSSTANQIDTFVMQDLPADAGSVYAVQSIITARQDAGAARTIAPVLRPAATDRVGTTVALSTTYQMLTQIYDLNPEDTAAWATTDVAGLEVGYKLIS